MVASIDPSTHREVFRHYDVACAPCRELYLFARRRDDLGALAEWRSQIAAHLHADRERRDFDRLVVQRLLGGSWTPEQVAAYRRARQESNSL